MKNKYVAEVKVPTIKHPDLFNLSDDQLRNLLKATDIELLHRETLYVGGARISKAVYFCYRNFLDKDYELRRGSNNKINLVSKKRWHRRELHNDNCFNAFCIRYVDRKKIKRLTEFQRKRFS